MPQFIEITSLDHPGCEVYTKLTEAQLRNRLEPEKGIFIAESPKVIQLALERGYELISILTEKRCLDGVAGDLLRNCGDIPVYLAEPDILSTMTGYKLNRGVLCAVRRPKPKSAEEICRNAHRIAVLENIVDTTNIGAVFRSAAALGIDACNAFMLRSAAEKSGARQHGDGACGSLGADRRGAGGLAGEWAVAAEFLGIQNGCNGAQRQVREH